MDSCVSIEGVTLDLHSNTADDQVIANCESALARGLPELTDLSPLTDKPLCIVGGGPSIYDTWPEIYRRAMDGQHVWALNGAHDWLLSKGVSPHAAWCVDSQPENAIFYKRPHHLTRYYIASRCDSKVFDALKYNGVTLWHDASCRHVVDQSKLLIGGGTTIGVKAMAGAYVCGYRELHLFGYDSSYMGETHHAYQQHWNDGEGVYEVAVGDRVFRCAPWMINQVKNFGVIAPKLQAEGCDIHVHGDGMLQWTATSGHRVEEAA